MALDTFTPPRNPTVGSSGDFQFRVQENKFEDSSQRIPLGTNNMDDTENLTWDLLTFEEFVYIRDFLKSKKGSEAFYYQLPENSEPEKWICPSFRKGYEHATYISCSAVFKRVYDLAD